MGMLLNLKARVNTPALYLALALCAATATTARAAVVLTGDPPPSSEQQGRHPPGSLTTSPAEQGEAGTKPKKCMTVCAHWGEECTYVNQGPGGTTKKCRRACKQFTEECF